MTCPLPLSAQHVRNLGVAEACYVASRARSFGCRRYLAGSVLIQKLCRAARKPKGGSCYCLQCRFVQQNGRD